MEWDKLESIQNVPLCDNLQKMRSYEKEFLYLSQVEEREVLKETGCLPPCQFSEYTLVENVPGFEKTYGYGLAYATTEVRIEEEDWVYPGLSFIGEFGGSLGLFVGFSFYTFWDVLVYIYNKWGPGKKDKVEDKNSTDMLEKQ